MPWAGRGRVIMGRWGVTWLSVTCAPNQETQQNTVATRVTSVLPEESGRKRGSLLEFFFLLFFNVYSL